MTRRLYPYNKHVALALHGDSVNFVSFVRIDWHFATVMIVPYILYRSVEAGSDVGFRIG